MKGKEALEWAMNRGSQETKSLLAECMNHPQPSPRPEIAALASAFKYDPFRAGKLSGDSILLCCVADWFNWCVIGGLVAVGVAG